MLQCIPRTIKNKRKRKNEFWHQSRLLTKHVPSDIA
jgi:hypothetical protein